MAREPRHSTMYICIPNIKTKWEASILPLLPMDLESDAFSISVPIKFVHIFLACARSLKQKDIRKVSLVTVCRQETTSSWTKVHRNLKGRFCVRPTMWHHKYHDVERFCTSYRLKDAQGTIIFSFFQRELTNYMVGELWGSTPLERSATWYDPRKIPSHLRNILILSHVLYSLPNVHDVNGIRPNHACI